jgi:thiamine-monophosphate kinase
VDLRSESFDVAEPLRAVGAALGADPLRFVLTGGDDHPLVATFPPETQVPDAWTRIGEVSVGRGVTVDGAAYDGPRGHSHF